MPRVKSQQRRCSKRVNFPFLPIPFHPRGQICRVFGRVHSRELQIEHATDRVTSYLLTCSYAHRPLRDEQQQNKFVWTLILFNKWSPLSCSFRCQLPPLIFDIRLTGPQMTHTQHLSWLFVHSKVELNECRHTFFWFNFHDHLWVVTWSYGTYLQLI